MLNQYETNGHHVDIVRESILMFLNPLFTDLQVREKNILVDNRSKSVFLTGSFTFHRLEDLILSELGQITENIYVFPNQVSNRTSAPFGFEIFLSVVATRECRYDLSERRNKLLKEATSKVAF